MRYSKWHIYSITSSARAAAALPHHLGDMEPFRQCEAVVPPCHHFSSATSSLLRPTRLSSKPVREVCPTCLASIAGCDFTTPLHACLLHHFVKGLVRRGRPNVRSGSNADVAATNSDIRVTPKSRTGPAYCHSDVRLRENEMEGGRSAAF
jgi:hypothetical protein